jgi:phosphatidylglycerophosphate synthase
MGSAVVVAPGAPAPRKVGIINPANAVTFSRFFTLPWLYWAVVTEHRQWATIAICVCGLLDKLDGLVAKVFDCRSAFGEVFDAITDGICYGLALLLVAVHGWAPWIPVISILVLGIANTAMRFVYARRAGRVANYKSYAMERLVAYTGYLIALATAPMETMYFYWVFVPLMTITVAYDAKRMLIDPVPGAAA